MVRNYSIYLLAIILLISGAAKAQNPEPNEQVRAALVAHITTRLSLSPEEAQRFWPVYNQFADERDDIKKDQQNLLSELKNQQVNEAKANLLLKDFFTLQQKETQLQQRYYLGELQDILGASRVITLMQAENEFKRMLLNRLRGRRENGRPRGRLSD